MPLTFPVDCDSPRRRTEYCYRAQELLRLIHNGMGRWLREGLTVQQWQRFPQRLKNRYPYKPQLSKAEWEDFETNVFERIGSRITQVLLNNRQQLKESMTWGIDVTGILED